MTITDIRKLSTSDLTKESMKLREEIAGLRTSQSIGESSNVRAIRIKRKDLARVLTVLSEALIKEAK